jgi:uncharacterized protein YjbI with pentapeptide repeats
MGEFDEAAAILLRRSAIGWQAEPFGVTLPLTIALPRARFEARTILEVVQALRNAAVGTPVATTWELKVAPRTKLQRDDIDALLAAVEVVSGDDTSHLDLGQCVLEGPLEGIKLAFVWLEGAFFTMARLEGADLTAAELTNAILGGVQLTGATLAAANLTRASLTMARLEGADLSDAELTNAFLSEARLEGAVLSGARMEGAKLKEAHLDGADLRGARLDGADLSGARLAGANLDFARLEGANLSGAWLEGATLTRARLERTDLSGVASLHGCRWARAFLDQTRLRRRQLGAAIGDEHHARREPSAAAYHEASEAYLLLKNNFTSIGRYQDASWAYIKEQQMEKQAYGLGWRKEGRPADVWRWLESGVAEYLTGHGERPWLPVLWAFVIVAVFTLIYYEAGNIDPDFGITSTGLEEVGVSASTVRESDQALEGRRDLGAALTHSVATFFTLGFNSLEPADMGARFLTSVEAALGIGFYALVLFTLGNRISRS